MADDLNDRLVLVNQETGDALETWTSAEVSSDFLTPCDTFRFEAASEDAPTDVAHMFPPGSKVIVKAFLREGVNKREAVLLDGVVDKVRLHSGRDGRKVSIEGRDFLGRVEDANVDPRMVLPNPLTIEKIVDAVLRGQFDLDYQQIEANEKAKQAIGPKLSRKPPKPRKPSSRRSRTAPVSEAKPRDNEGAYGYLQRLLTTHGYQLWAARSAERRYAVVSGPDYDQDSSCRLLLRRGAAGGANNIKTADLEIDESKVPSHVFVKGSEYGASDRNTKMVALATNPVASAFKPVFLVDQRAKDKESTERIARAFLGRQLRNYITYRVTVSGMADLETGALYAVDTICDVEDEDCGLFGRMWVESCSLRQGRGGTTTDLKLIPPGTLVLDWQPDEQIDNAAAFDLLVAQQIGSKSFAATREFVYHGVEFWRKAS